jgi:hypothetical protein
MANNVFRIVIPTRDSAKWIGEPNCSRLAQSVRRHTQHAHKSLAVSGRVSQRSRGLPFGGREATTEPRCSPSLA